MKLATKLILTAVAALAVALVSIGLTLLASWQLEGSAAAINDAGSLRMRTFRLAYLAQVDDGTRARRALEIAEYDAILANLAHGDPARPLFLPGTQAVRASLAEVNTQWAALRTALSDGDGTAANAARLDSFVDAIDALVRRAEADVASSTTLLRAAQLGLIALAVVGAVGFMYLSFLLVVRPVEHLHEGLDRMAAGELSARLPVETNDEFGELARGFNAMGERLQGLYASLEDRVAEKTRSLAEQNARVATLYDLAAFLNRGAALPDLAQGAIERIAQSVGADGGFVRLASTDGGFALAAQSGASQALVDAERCIPRERCSCGRAAASTMGLVDLPNDATLACARGGFAMVASFPIAAQGEAIGVFTLLFRTPRALGADTRQMLTTIGQHLGAAIANLRLAALERGQAVAKERNLLAEELHDSIAQSLAFLNLQGQMLEQSLARDDGPRAKAVTAEIRTGVQECFADVRELLHHFRSASTGVAIEDAIATMAQRFRRQAGLDIAIESTGDAMPLAPDVQTQVMHILHEALSNVRKHAGTDHVVLRIERGDPFRFVIADRGRGFDPQARKGDDHIGLRIMRERAARLGASVAVDSRPGEGTRVTLELPLVAEKAAA